MLVEESSFKQKFLAEMQNTAKEIHASVNTRVAAAKLKRKGAPNVKS